VFLLTDVAERVPGTPHKPPVKHAAAHGSPVADVKVD
jgi:hypothetical protein